MRSAETIVYFVSSDVTRGQMLRECFSSCGRHVVPFYSAARYDPARGDDRTACLIIDLDHLDVSGLEFQRELVEGGAPPIVIMAAQGDPASCVRAVKEGAIDVLLAPIDPEALRASVEVALICDQKRRSERTERTSLLTRWRTLTPRESEVFHHTVAGLLNKQAAAELGVAENTYQVHRGRVMRKMQANSLADLVRMSMKLEPILSDSLGDHAWKPQVQSEESVRAKRTHERTSIYFRSISKSFNNFGSPARY